MFNDLEVRAPAQGLGKLKWFSTAGECEAVTEVKI